MRQPRVRLRMMMAAVAFLALVLAVIVQSVRFQQALVREQRLRAEAELERAGATLARASAQAVAYQVPSGGPTAKGRKVIPTPHLRVGGRVNRISRPAKGVIHLDAFVPGARSAATFFLLKAGKPSMLLRAGEDGRMTPIRLVDLYEGDELNNVRAVISRETDSVDKAHLVYWLVVYPKGVMAPPLWDKEADTTYD